MPLFSTVVPASLCFYNRQCNINYKSYYIVSCNHAQRNVSSCIICYQGSRVILVSNKTSQSLQPSVFESPLFERSHKGHSVCVRFRYITYGFGRRVLRLYQQLESINKTKRLMWAVNESNNTEGTWKYGRVSLPSVTKHRVSIILQVVSTLNSKKHPTKLVKRAFNTIFN